MRIIHTADWHLGRIFYGIHLTEDQAYVLEEFLEIVKYTKADVVIISGDIYDRAVPPQDAVSLLDDIISRLVRDIAVPVIMISGNHDSPERLNFGSKLFATSNLYIFGKFSPNFLPVTLGDKFGLVDIYPISYLEPSIVREKLNKEEILTHELAFKEILNIIRLNKSLDRRAILVAHAAVLGGATSDSERPLSIGGSETIDPSIFEGFNYIALGHLHRPQSVKKDYIRYPGSILKYSFSEVSHKKSVTFIEMDEKGSSSIEDIPLTPRHNVRIIKGKLEDILAGSELDANREDYIMVMLMDEHPVLNAMAKLRKVYPNTLHIERCQFMPSNSCIHTYVEHQSLSEKEIFSSFFNQVTGKDMSIEEEKAFLQILEKLRAKNREAS